MGSVFELPLCFKAKPFFPIFREVSRLKFDPFDVGTNFNHSKTGLARSPLYTVVTQIPLNMNF